MPVQQPATGDLLLPGETFGTQIVSLPDANTPPGVYTNTARASTSTEESNDADNIDTRDIQIVDPVADLIVDKTAITSPIVAGETFTYQIAAPAGLIDLATFTLRLSSNAKDVVITDTLPAGLVPTSATRRRAPARSPGRASPASSAPSSRRSRSIPSPRRSSPSRAPSRPTPTERRRGIANTAVGTTSTALPGGAASVSSTTATPLTRTSDLGITKTAASPTVAAGASTSFTLNVTNSGPSDATGVEVTDLLPPPLLFDPAGSDPSCADGASVVCAIGTVPAGETVSTRWAPPSRPMPRRPNHQHCDRHFRHHRPRRHRQQRVRPASTWCAPPTCR